MCQSFSLRLLVFFLSLICTSSQTRLNQFLLKLCDLLQIEFGCCQLLWVQEWPHYSSLHCSKNFQKKVFRCAQTHTCACASTHSDFALYNWCYSLYKLWEGRKRTLSGLAILAEWQRHWLPAWPKHFGWKKSLGTPARDAFDLSSRFVSRLKCGKTDHTLKTSYKAIVAYA